MAVCTVYTAHSLNSTCSISTPTKTHLGFNQKHQTLGVAKSTFMRRLTSVFGGAAEPPRGGNPDSNTLISDTTTGLLDPPELIKPPKILVIEGLHPMYDQRVRDLLDFSIYLDISNEVKFAWKIQRDMAERGHSLESIKASIEARKPDFDAYIDPQKQYADAVIEVLPTQLIPDDNEGKVFKS
ncbi:hypothetical protein OIU77_027352 [Salix suchowensis]|uniref:Phosphoribulokinase, chloroplastic n=1 Tax=Salix suchowensis TaxID=1278906 RepID=A0ABQ9BRU5_9ROSI|nr:hypothetical protein OIU77_027352 [Salix suchowensis]